MGEVIRFPQELCRWPALSDLHHPPAVILILPVVRVERDCFIFADIGPDGVLVMAEFPVGSF